jgi:hypothetical protein
VSVDTCRRHRIITTSLSSRLAIVVVVGLMLVVLLISSQLCFMYRNLIACVTFSFSQGCLYDGKFYNETEAVVTKEPCLNCSCRNGALRCHLQVCPFLHDIYPPPAGCVLVERKNACCPKLHCRKYTYLILSFYPPPCSLPVESDYHFLF